MNLNDFDRDFRRMRRQHNFMSKAVGTFIAVVFVLVLATIIGLGVVAFKAAGEVGDRGLKSVLTELWDGPKAP